MMHPARGSRWLALLAPRRAVALGLGLLLLLFAAGSAHAQGLCTAPANGNIEAGWLDVTWTGAGCTGVGNFGQAVPGANADVVIPNLSTIRCGTAPTLLSLTVGSLPTPSTAVLNMGSGVAAGTLLIKGDLTNYGTIQNRPATTWINSIAVGGRWTNSGTFTPGTTTPRIDVTLNGTSATTIGGTSATTFNNLTISGSGTKTLGANVTTSGTLTLTSGTLDPSNFTFTANGTVTCGGGAITDSSATGTFSYATAGAQPVCAGNYGALTFGSGNKTLPATGTVGIAGVFTPGGGTPTVTGSTINFNGAGAQGVPAFPYNSLTIAGSGTKTLAGSQAVAGALSLASGTLAVGTNTLTANGAVTCGSGTFSSSATGTVSYQAAGQTVCAGNYGNLTLSSVARTLAPSGIIGIAGTFTVGATAPTVTGSTVSFNGAAQNIPAFTFNNLDIAGSGIKTMQGTVTAGGTLSLTAGTLSVNTRTLNANGAVTCGTGAITSSATGIVSYGGPAGQNVCAGTYGNLTFNNQSKTLASSGTIAIAAVFTPGAAGTPTITGSTVNFSQAAAGQIVPAFNYNNLTLTGGAKTLINGGTIGIAGTFTPVGTPTVTNNTVSFNGSGAQNIPAFTFNNLQTAGSGVKTITGNVSTGTTGTLTVGSGTTFSQTANTLTLGSGGLVNNGKFSVDGNGGGCRTTDTRATIQSSNTTARNWTGTGAFQLIDVTLTNQNSGVGTITAFNAAGTGNSGITLNTNICTGAPAFPTAVRLASFTATVHGGRVLLRWQTAMETDNIGFRLYREAGDVSSPVTPHLISGSALMVGRRASMSGGRSYVWWDDLPAGAAARTTRYWLADVDLSGEQTFHGPVVPEPSYQPPPDVRNAPHLQQLARLNGAPGASPESSVQGGPAGRVLRGLSPRTPTTIAAQWALASGRALKIGISHPAWYRVTGHDLRDHGLGSVDPTRLQLFADGQQIPLVVRGLARGRQFVPESTIEFYATGLDSQWSSERSYWLVAGTSAGERIGRVSAAASTAAPASFPFTVESRPKTIYFMALMNGEPNKYFGPIVSTDAQAPTTVTLDVRNADLSTAGQAVLDVAVQGVMNVPHLVAILLNGSPVGQIELSGQGRGTAHLLLDQAASLHEGPNQIALWAEGGQMDLSLVESVGLTYARRYVADGDTLSMTAPGDSHLVVGGFSSPRIRVMDVTDPENPYELVAAVHSDGTSGYAAATEVAGAGVRNLLAFTDEKIASPASVKTNNPSNWHSADRAASLIILTHAAVADALQPLVRLRQGQGYMVAVVDVEDVYDEFSFGNKTPQALRDFLALASSTWRKRPGFVLLAGSASADPRNFLGYGDSDLVPTKFVEATYNQAASDDWFVDFNDDGLPSLAIGRLPVRDSIQAAAVVQKLVGYSRTGGADWKRTAVLVSGPATEDFDFPAATNVVAAQIPTSMFLTQIFRGDFADDTLAHAAVLGAFNQGALLVNYMGHASETAWQGNLLSMDDVPLLTNGSRLAFVSSMTCWTGWFADPYGETLGEALLKTPQGGAIAVWASSGLTEPDGQMALDREFMRLLFAARKPTIGEATARAKAAVSDLDIRHTWILLGDPTTKLE